MALRRELSRKKIIRSKHSSLRLRLKRSEWAFRFRRARPGSVPASCTMLRNPQRTSHPVHEHINACPLESSLSPCPPSTISHFRLSCPSTPAWPGPENRRRGEVGIESPRDH